MYLFLVKAKASEGNRDYPENQKHGALIFVLADDLEQAREKITPEMSNLHWDQVKIEREKEVDHENMKQAEEPVKNAYKAARRTGFAALIYSDPLN